MRYVLCAMRWPAMSGLIASCLMSAQSPQDRRRKNRRQWGIAEHHSSQGGYRCGLTFGLPPSQKSLGR
jgi:hypothetical protein